MPVAGSASTSSPLARATPVDAADALGVRRRDGRDDADVGAADGAQAGDLAEAAHAHLEHEHLGVVGRAEDRDRQALLVVEAALVGGDPPAGADGGAHEVLGARLADAAGDADDGGGEPVARPRRQRPSARRRCRRPRSTGIAVSTGRRGQRRGRRRRRPRRRRSRGRRARRRAARTAGRAAASGSRTRRRRARRRGRAACRRWRRPRRMPGSSPAPNGTVAPHEPRTGSTSSCCSAGSRPSTT